jgi:cytochrome P450 family 109
MIVAKLEPRIEKIAHGMIDSVVDNGKMDLIDDLAYPVPVTILLSCLVPIEDRNLFSEWATEY